MKQTFSVLFKGLLYLIACAGPVLICYGIYFQTEGFVHVSFFYCLLGAAASGTAGVLGMRYFEDASSDGTAGPITAGRALKTVLQGLVILFLICLLVLYRCRAVYSFFIGECGTVFSCASLWVHLAAGFKNRKMLSEKEEPV